jgi:hypothetical protein
MNTFVPQGDSEAVQKLKAALHLDSSPMRLRVVPEPGARELNCFEIIDDKVRRQGGHIPMAGFLGLTARPGQDRFQKFYSFQIPMRPMT